MSITLYSTHCPQCAMLEKQLAAKKIEFTICDDMEKMLQLGIKKAPMLEADSKLMTFPEGLRWVKEHQ